MSQLQEPKNGYLFYSVLYKKKHWSKDKVISLLELDAEKTYFLEPEFNPLENYYSKEMGEDLGRIIVYEKILKNREELVQKKVTLTLVENFYAKDGKRTLNIDVGLMSLENTILATGKPYTHRVYLSEGVYAELTYYYKDGKLNSFPWTYPDYQHQEKLDFFMKVRENLKVELQ